MFARTLDITPCLVQSLSPVDRNLESKNNIFLVLSANVGFNALCISGQMSFQCLLDLLLICILDSLKHKESFTFESIGERGGCSIFRHFFAGNVNVTLGLTARHSARKWRLCLPTASCLKYKISRANVKDYQGQTSQAASYPFFGYFNLLGFHHKITFITTM